MTTCIIPELNLKNIIAESREVAQALNGFADDLERIEKKYADPQESEEKPPWLGKNCKDCGNEKCKKIGTLPKGYDCALWQEKESEVVKTESFHGLTFKDERKTVGDHLQIMMDEEILESLKSYTCKPEVIDRAIAALKQPPRIKIGDRVYMAEHPKLKTIHGKTGEVVIGGFKEVQE